MKSLDSHELAWAAGFIDGEGCFHIDAKKYPTLTVGQSCYLGTDPDGRLTKLQSSLDVGLLRFKARDKPHYKDNYVWIVCGFERVQYVTAAIWPWLSDVKRSQARAILLGSRSVKSNYRGREGLGKQKDRTHCPQGHSYDNARIDPRTQKRICRLCQRDNQRAYRLRKGNKALRTKGEENDYKVAGYLTCN